jgi:c-di-GMP-binding flagellar brake protein YcgR
MNTESIAMLEENVVSKPVSSVARRAVPRLSDALDRIAPSIKSHEMSDPFDIGEALDALAQSGEPLTIYPGGRGDAIMARIDSVDPELPHFTLDIAGGARLPAGLATFVSAVGGTAKIQFDLTQSWIGLPDRPNLVKAAFPAVCQVLNRRAQPRREAPVGAHYTAAFVVQGKTYRWPLCDYSLGGIGLRATREEAKGFFVGRKLEGVRLQLGPALLVTADLEIRLLRPYRTFLLGEQVQVGCRFTNISMQVEQGIGSLVNGADETQPA